MMGLGAILFSLQNRRCRKSAPNCNIMGANGDKKAAISRGASCKFVSRRKCIIWRLLTILRFAHDRPMLQIGSNLRSCGGESWSRTHAAANREFDDDLPGRSLAPYPGWRAALFPGYLRIMATNEHRWPLSDSHHGGLEGGLFSPISADYGDERTRMAALWLHYEAGGRPFSPEMRRLCRRPCCPPAPHHGGWRAAFCPDMRRLWRQGEYAMLRSRRPSSAPIKERSITCCPKSCEPSQRRWSRSRKRLNTDRMAQVLERTM